MKIRPLPVSVTLSPLGATPREALHAAVRLGVRHVQLSALHEGARPRQLDQTARRDLAASLRRMELSCSGIDCFIPPEHFADPQRADRAMHALSETIDLAGRLDRAPVCVTLPAILQQDKPEAAGASGLSGDRSLLMAIAERGDLHGVPIADCAIPLSEHDGIGIGIDPAAWLAEKDDPATAIMRAGDRLVCARLCDLHRSGMRGPLGRSAQHRLDVDSYRAALSVIDYQRPVVIDARQWMNVFDNVESTIRMWDAV